MFKMEQFRMKNCYVLRAKMKVVMDGRFFTVQSSILKKDLFIWKNLDKRVQF